MTTWNYRVAKNALGETAIVEVYYDEEGNVTYWSGPIKPFGEDIEDLRADMQNMLQAFDKPLFDKIIEEEE